MPHPATAYFDDAGSAVSSGAVAFPALLKPARGSYGRGIVYLERPEQARAFAGADVPGGYILQSYVEGYDVDCSVLCVDGRIVAHTIQRGFLPGYHRFGAPAGIEFVHDRRVYDVASHAMRALCWSGVAHIDLRWDRTDDTIKVIEINPRYWGSLLGSLVAGVNFPYLACAAAAGEKVIDAGFREARFVAGRAAVREFARRVVFAGGPASSAYTPFPFALADPGATVAGFAQSVLRRN